jgi:hypothetical protein
VKGLILMFSPKLFPGRPAKLIFVILICIPILITSAHYNPIAAADDDHWDERFGSIETAQPGPDDAVRAITTFGSQVFVGGDFLNTAGAAAKYVASWEAGLWSSYGNTLSNVHALTCDGTHVYAGGEFQLIGGMAASRVAKWDGSSWSALGGGTTDIVRAVAVSGGHLYAGGDFTYADGNPANRIARWDGASWSNLGTGMNQRVRAIAASGSYVYAGGDFTSAGGAAASRIARWDGASWSPLGTGLDGSVWAIAVDGDDVYVGGTFTTAGGIASAGIAKWNESTLSWDGLDGGVSGAGDAVYALGIVDGNVLVGGSFYYAGGIRSRFIARWDGGNWVGYGDTLDGIVQAISVRNVKAYFAGDFTHIGCSCAGPIERVGSWTPHNGLSNITGNTHGLSGSSFDVLSSGENIYAVGNFMEAGLTNVMFVARWNGYQWLPLGSGTSGTTETVTQIGSDIYVGGSFYNSPAHNLAKWDGSTWSAVDENFSGPVYALAAQGTDLFVGGAFTGATSMNLDYIARWDGASWHHLGSGINDYVYDFEVQGGRVYVGGEFTTAGGYTVNRVAYWESSAWHPMGTGVDGTVQAVVADGSDVYVAGEFLNAGGSLVRRVARWNGSSWSALGWGLSGGIVYDLAIFDGTLYAGGSFTLTGTDPLNGLARWDGSEWVPIGSGVAGGAATVFSIDFDDAGNMIVGGSFGQAGGTPSYNFGVWNRIALTGGTGGKPSPGITALYQNYPNPFNPVTTITYRVSEITRVSLVVYDVSGRRVKILVDEIKQPNSAGHEVRWDGTNETGQTVVSGTYFYRLITGNVDETRKMTFLK